MKTRLFLSILILAALFAHSQTPRLSLYEEFTGENCGPCAQANPGLDAILSSSTNTAKVVFIKWQVPIPNPPATTWSLYQTNKNEINLRYRSTTNGGYGYPTQPTANSNVADGIISAPCGLFDGQFPWKFGALGHHPTYVTNSVISNAQAVMSPFSVVMAKAWNPSMSSVNLTVNIVASMNYTASGPLVFRAVMIENMVEFSLPPGTNGEVEFAHPVIASFPTLHLGTPLTRTWVTGQTYSFTLNCPVPSYTRDKNQVDMVGFIQDDGSKKVEQAVRASTCTLQGLSISANNTVVCKGESVVLTASGSSNYSWNKGQTSYSIAVTPSTTTNYWVKGGTAGGCPNIAAIALKVINCTGLTESRTGDLQFSVSPNPNNGEFIITANGTGDNMRIVLFNTVGQKVFEQTINTGKTSIKTSLKSGLYYYEVLGKSQSLNNGKIVIE